MGRSRGATLVIAVLLAPAVADATYSIAAVDLATGQAGGAGTSCVGSQLSVYEIFGTAPGFGVVMAQAALNRAARDRAVELLGQGADAPDVLADITGSDFDFAAAVRQYAVIDARGAAAGFTGDATMAYADDVQGREGDVVYSVQGNILTSAAVLQQAAAVFATPGCDLAETLMLALAAGADNGEGDSRCTPDGIPSDGAFLRVDLADGDPDAPYLELQVDDTAPDDPIADLRALYDAWRADHACPASDPGGPTDAGMSSPDAGTSQGGAPSIDASAGAQGGSGVLPGAGAGGTAWGAPVAGAAAGSGADGAAGAGGAAGGAAGVAAPIVPPGAASGETSSGCAVIGRRGRAAGAAYVMCSALAWVVLAAVRVRARERRRLSPPPRA